jgi:hypothetical protein
MGKGVADCSWELFSYVGTIQPRADL